MKTAICIGNDAQNGLALAKSGEIGRNALVLSNLVLNNDIKYPQDVYVKGSILCTESVSCPGVRLYNLSVKGDLIVDGGNVNLFNVAVTGKIVVMGKDTKFYAWNISAESIEAPDTEIFCEKLELPMEKVSCKSLLTDRSSPSNFTVCLRGPEEVNLPIS